ncbi:MAG: bifunctional ornithine acetyltransferase/N-acetylglutamate synthase [Deltaproteobacteria bacterium GWA2_45_12]|nr:MAG: bifunctional ornithine acetyltransferase/N-acetylglutamate synthase [Deltaproteobacteria bacterium GWA2_45_12]
MKPKKNTIPGFQFAGFHCGIKDDIRKKDIAFIYSEEPNTLVDGVFTTNKVFAAPVTVCRDVVKKGIGRLIVINSGVANACTGMKGMQDALQTQKVAAKEYALNPNEVLVCSTGKIGDTLPMSTLIKGIRRSKNEMGKNYFMDAVRGIMTTDQYPKYATATGTISGKKYTIAVLAKGAGMLCPNMATMLAYVVTDLRFDRKTLKTIFRNAVDKTLNRITVDGDTSTNDTVLILANGRAGNKTFSVTSREGKQVETQLTALLEDMARKITLDGEGATKCCRVEIKGAKNESEAKKIAYAIGNSPLVKTALFGCDPNWGRIMAAVGYSGASIVQEKLNVWIGSHQVVKNGSGVKRKSMDALNTYMKKRDMDIKVDCHMGRGEFFIFMSDLTYDYIHLNAEYHT